MSDAAMDWNDYLRTYGYYAVHFAVTGVATPDLGQLREWMRTDSPKYTGWAPFWWPTRAEIEPQVIDQQTYECLHDGTGPSGHIERWRARTWGDFTIIRSHDSDRVEPGKYIDLVLPVWRVAEILLYAGRIGERFRADNVDFTVKFTGLCGRVLTTRHTPGRLFAGVYSTRAKEYEKRVSVPVADLSITVVDVVEILLKDFYALFQYTLPPGLCEQEIAEMRRNRF